MSQAVPYSVDDQTPGLGYISWANVSIFYDGAIQPIANGSTNKRYVYWLAASPTVMFSSDAYPTLGPEDCIVFLNNGGVAHSVLDSDYVHGDLIISGTVGARAIAVGAIRADHISAGAITADKIDAFAITAEHIGAGVIEADHIKVGSITADRIDVSDLFAQELTIRKNGFIQSEDYAANPLTAGFRIAADGSAIFNEVTVRGKVYSAEGTIGGFTIGAATITGGSLSLASSGNITAGSGADIIRISADDATYRMWIGSSSAASAPFRVTKAGILTASNAVIGGTISTSNLTATGGTIGSWIIGSDVLKSASSGARVELNKTKNRLSVYDSANSERVVMGYLEGLQKPGVTPAQYFTASDYGYWIAPGDAISFNGDVMVDGASFSVKNASISFKRYDGAEWLRIGDVTGLLGLTGYDVSRPSNYTAFGINAFQGDGTGYATSGIRIDAFLNGSWKEAIYLGFTNGYNTPTDYTKFRPYFSLNQALLIPAGLDLVNGNLTTGGNVISREQKFSYGLRSASGSFYIDNTDGTVVFPLPTVAYNSGYFFVVEDKNTSIMIDGVSRKTYARMDLSAKIANWDGAYYSAHNHSDWGALETITTAKVANWNSAYSNSHTHSNKTTLDGINQSLSTGSSPSFVGVNISGASNAHVVLAGGSVAAISGLSVGVAASVTGLILSAAVSIGGDPASSAIGYASGLGALGVSSGALYCQVQSADYKAEIFQDYITGRLAVRGKANGTWGSWLTVIDSGNIGSQSVSYAASAGIATKLNTGTSAPTGGASGDVYIQY